MNNSLGRTRRNRQRGWVRRRPRDGHPRGARRRPRRGTDVRGADETAGEISDAGGRADAHHLNISRTGNCQSVTDAALAGHGKIDGLHGDAGIVVGGVDTAVDLSEEQWERIINTVPASIWRTRPDGTIDFLNACCLQYIGMTMQEGLDAGCRGQIHPDDYAQAHSNWLSAMVQRKPFECMVRIRRFDGDIAGFSAGRSRCSTMPATSSPGTAATPTFMTASWPRTPCSGPGPISPMSRV